MRFNSRLLKKLRKQKKWSQKDAADKCGIAPGTYIDVEQKPFKNPKYLPHFATIEAIEKGFGVSPGTFLNWDDDAQSPDKPGRPKASSLLDDGPFRIPLLGKAAAGRAMHPDWQPDKFLDVQEDFKGDVYAVRVYGDSMEDEKIKETDHVIVRRSPEATPGEIVLVYITREDGFTIKKYSVVRDRKTGQPVKTIFKPRSANADHKSYEFSDDSEFQIFGVYVGVIRKEK